MGRQAGQPVQLLAVAHPSVVAPADRAAPEGAGDEASAGADGAAGQGALVAALHAVDGGWAGARSGRLGLRAP